MEEINEKKRQCKLVMAGKLPLTLDVEEQSSTLPKSKVTLKLEQSRLCLVKAKHQALSLREESVSSNEETEQPTAQDKKKARRKKVSCTIPSAAVTSDEDDSKTI